MSTHHPTTAALLLALRHDHHTGGLGSGSIAAHRQWGAAGCPDAPEPRFVPTEPGWYWRKRDAAEVVKVCALPPYGSIFWSGPSSPAPALVEDDGLWLGPVAPWSEAHPDPGPCPPKPRTADEARANPMPGDRWAEKRGDYHYTLQRRGPSRWWCRFGDDSEGDHDVGLPFETYLGNFPVDP